MVTNASIQQEIDDDESVRLQKFLESLDRDETFLPIEDRHFDSDDSWMSCVFMNFIL